MDYAVRHVYRVHRRRAAETLKICCQDGHCQGLTYGDTKEIFGLLALIQSGDQIIFDNVDDKRLGKRCFSDVLLGGLGLRIKQKSIILWHL